MTHDRETTALTEIGHTQVSRRTAWFLTLSFVMMLVTAAFCDLFFRVFNSDNPVFPPAEDVRLPGGPLRELRQTNAEWLSQIHIYEDALNQHSPLTQWFIPQVQQLLWKRLQYGNEKVYVGSEDWLFYRPGMDYLTGPNFMSARALKMRKQPSTEWQEIIEPNPVKAIVEMNDQLASRGITLLVVPTPTKAMLYGNRFSKLRADGKSPLNNEGYRQFVDELHKAHVHVLNIHESLAKHMDRPLFLKTDSHWTPEGMSIAADTIAKQVISLHPEIRPSSPAAYRVVPRRIENRGDLAVMLRINDPTATINHESTLIRQVLTRDGDPWHGDVASSVLLLGDSFSNIYSLSAMNWGDSAGLAEHLSVLFQQPIDAIRINDNGAFATRFALSKMQRRGIDRLAGKKVVIYQFAIRELSNGNWKSELSYAPAAASSRPATASASVVHGTIREIKTLPATDDSTYRDCLIPMVLSNVTSETGKKFEQDIVVYVWGMLDGTLTAHNRLRRGDSVTLPITPFEQMENTLGSFRRLDFTSGPYLLLEAYAGDDRLPGGKLVQKKRFPYTPVPNAGRTMRQKNEPPDTALLLDTVSTLLTEENRPVFVGKNGWLFLNQELRHLSKGTFWGDAAPKVSEAENTDVADPIPAILDFQHQLQTQGISLLLVPVPPKAVVYPEMLDKRIAMIDERPDFYHRQFYRRLAEEGVNVLDLTDLFYQKKQTEANPLYCETDSHWSATACRLAAEEIQDRITPYLKNVAVPQMRFTTVQKEISIEGDLWRRLEDNNVTKEVTTVFEVFAKQSETTRDITWKQSPVLLIGDSHTLVFHAGGDMLAENAGLSDQLAAALGFPVDLMGVRGSGTTMARVGILRRQDSLVGKKVVVWCFTARDFTESTSGWAIVPVSR